MHHGWLARLFFAVLCAIGISAVVSGTACTRWGQPGPVTPTVAPLTALYVNPSTGSDSTGNGSMAKPYKTLTKAVSVLAASKNVSPSGVTITLASGDYDTANGEIFPIVVPRNVSITGSAFGSGPKSGSFIDGLGEDRLFEQVLHAPPHSAYATLEVIPGVSLNIGDVYVGASKVKLPSSRAGYVSFDDLGTTNATVAAFGAGILSTTRNVSGVIVPGGSLMCTSCQIHANYFGIGALAVPIATASPSGTVPSITLAHAAGGGDSTIAAKIVCVITDGNVNVMSSDETFSAGQYAFEDSLQPVVSSTTRGVLDFGGGAAGSTGGNILIGARRSEIFISRRGETVSALDDTWNPNQQHANHSGQYPRKKTFASGASGKNVTILHSAAGSTVLVGPAPAPTPTPSVTPSVSPSPTPS